MRNGNRAFALFIEFMKFGCFTFGGGLNIVAQMHKLYVEERKTISNVELLDLASVARSLPGTFIGNVAFLFGYREAGYLGAFQAVIGMVFPPFVIIALLVYFYNEFHNNAGIMSAMNGIRAAVVPIMASAVLNLLNGAFPHKPCYVVAVLAFCLYLFFGVSCVWLVILGAVAGLALSCYYEHKGGDNDGAA